MNLIQLGYVNAVADTCSFTRAAERCFVTQPTLSNGIAQLEEEFGERFFTRTTRSVTLTPFGEHMMPFIKNILEAETALSREVLNYAAPFPEIIRIGTSPLMSASRLGPLIGRFRELNPGTRVILREMNMDDLYRMLDDDQLDFVFGVADDRKSSRHSAFLYQEPLYFIPRGDAVPPGANKQSIRLEDVADETFLMVPNICGLARATRALFRKLRRKLKEYQGEALSYQVLEEWAMLGLGAAILPKSKLSASNYKALLLKDNRGRTINIKFEAVWLSTNPDPTLLQAFIAHLHEFV